MSIVERTVTQTYWICDACGNEFSYDALEKCIRCKKEICPSCSTSYEFTLLRWHRGRGEQTTLRREGLSGIFCPECAAGLEAELVKLGFKPFSYDIKPL